MAGNANVVLVEREVGLIEASRPELIYDVKLRERQQLYRKLAVIGGWQIVLLVMMLLGLLLPLLALIDLLRNNFEGQNKLIWTLVILFLPVLGAILYFIIGVGQKVTSQH